MKSRKAHLIGWLLNNEVFYSSKTSGAIWISFADGISRLSVKDAAVAVSSPDGRCFESGKLIKKLRLRPERFETSAPKKLQWTADGGGIYFISRTNGASNIWRQPIDDSAPVQVTNFEDGRIFNFTFSPDYSQIALSRGTVNSDVVLIENAQ